MDLSRCRPDPERRAAATWTAEGRLVFLAVFFLAMAASLVWLLSVEVNRGRDGQREAYDDCDDEWDLNQGRYEHGVLRVVWRPPGGGW